MSGGHFYGKTLDDIAEEIRKLIILNDEYGSPGGSFGSEVMGSYKRAWLAIKTAEVYIKHVDYLIKGDHSEAHFLKRLDNDLTTVKKEFEHDLFTL